MNLQIDDTRIREAVEAFVRAAMADPIFAHAMLLAQHKGFGPEQTLQLLTALTAKLPEIRWDHLGNPNIATCQDMSGHVKQAASVVEAWAREGGDTALPVLPVFPRTPDLLTYAVLHNAAALSFGELVSILGTESVVDRLRRFAKTLDAVSMVG